MKNMHPLIELYNNYGLKDESVISNELVCKIFSNISFVPGRTSAYIAKSLGIDPKTVEWHTRKLADANILSQNSGKNKYWIKGIISENELKYLDALNFSTSQIIMSRLLNKDEINLKDLNLNRVNANKKIRLLENLGFLEEERKGKEVFLLLEENFIKFRDTLKGRANIFVANYLRRLKLSKINFEILNVTNFSISVVTDFGIPIVLSRDPIYTLITYG